MIHDMPASPAVTVDVSGLRYLAWRPVCSSLTTSNPDEGAAQWVAEARRSARLTTLLAVVRRRRWPHRHRGSAGVGLMDRMRCYGQKQRIKESARVHDGRFRGTALTVWMGCPITCAV